MLTLTENANQVLKAIADQTQQGDDAGLRISQEGTDATSLAVEQAEAPTDGDQVIEETPGARVFLEENAAATLDDKVLDAEVDQSGGVEFRIGVQADETPA